MAAGLDMLGLGLLLLLLYIVLFRTRATNHQLRLQLPRAVVIIPPRKLEYATPAVFSIIVIASFWYYIHKFLEVYLDNWIVYNILKDHVAML